MSDLDVLILTPTSGAGVYQSLSNNLAAIEPPIWAALLANRLRSKKFKVQLIDSEGLGWSLDETVKNISHLNARLTVVVVYGQQPSASTQNMHGARLLTRALRDWFPDRKTLMVGGHVSALPERSLLEESVDFVCQGEGPSTIEGLLALDRLEPTGFAKVPGLWYRNDEGKIEHGPQATVIDQAQLATELPGMAWDMLPMKNYRAHNWHCFDHIGDRQPYASLYTSLGCPFKCTFCCINAPFGGSSFRYWDPNFILQEFDTLANQYGVKNIKIADEMFVMNQNHFLKLCNLIGERNYGFNIWAYARIDTVKPQYLQALKKAGVNWLALGIESGSKHVRDGVTKGRFGQEDIHAIVRQIQDAGIYVIGNYIFGLPDDTYSSMHETLTLAEELNCEMSNFYSAMAYPGSKLYTIALEKGWKLPDSWLGFSQHAFDTLPLPTDTLTAGEVLAFRDYAFDRVFNSGKFHSMVNQKFGSETLGHIQEMCKHKLGRKYAVPREQVEQRVREISQ